MDHLDLPFYFHFANQSTQVRILNQLKLALFYKLGISLGWDYCHVSHPTLPCSHRLTVPVDHAFVVAPLFLYLYSQGDCALNRAFGLVTVVCCCTALFFFLVISC